MAHDNQPNRQRHADDIIDDDADDLSVDAAIGIWGDDMFRMEERSPVDQMHDPVARFKDRLRRAASERQDRPRDDTE